MHYYLGAENERVILFVDILGFSKLVESNDSFDIICNKPQGISLIFQKFYDEISNVKFSKENQLLRNEKFLWASDSIIISTRIDNIDVLIEDLIYLQGQMYCGHMAMRGAITVGKLYHEGNVWGEPLIRAVRLEKDEKVSLFPRVVISVDDFKRLNINEKHAKYFVQNELDVDYLSVLPFRPNIDVLLENDKIINTTINVYLKMIIENIKDETDERVIRKWQWMAREFYLTLITDNDEIRSRLLIEKELGYKNCDLDVALSQLHKLVERVDINSQADATEKIVF